MIYRVGSFVGRFICCVAACSLCNAMRAQEVLPLWSGATPEVAQTSAAEQDITKPSDGLISGHRTARLTNITRPSLTVYLPPANLRNTGAAALVFPGGGYTVLAWDGEGLDTCRWLNSIGMTCLLVKYRVPEKERFPKNFADLEDAQQAMRLARSHAADWKIDPTRIGVVGFSAGAHLAVLLSTHWDDTHVASTPAAAESDGSVDARPAFQVLAYPAYLSVPPENLKLDPSLSPRPQTPPAFIIQAEDDKNFIDSSLVYFRALKDAHIAAELHLYPSGGHGFGVFPVKKPETNWATLASSWLCSSKFIAEP